jgi:hypothetical protein
VCRSSQRLDIKTVVSTSISEEFVIGVRGIDRVGKYGLMSAHTVSSVFSTPSQQVQSHSEKMATNDAQSAFFK